ncbi:MAG: bifunctional adenosylcobinamide kinase/adenosylcobinamide-phosphate guanylyltransferase [Acidimicrobiales bacterium]
MTLVLGGARSGKSGVAESLAHDASGPVTYLATGVAGDDADFTARIAEHRRRRPAAWATLECGARLTEALARVEGTVVVDALGTWLAAHVDFEVDVEALLDALDAHRGDSIVVSDEVGLGVHPESAVGRSFRDALGRLNQSVAARADTVLLVVAGCVVVVKDGSR